MLKIAHRSGPVSYPEQTVASAIEALSFGADIIEIDLRLTSDGELAVTHDENLSRVFGVDKSVHSVSAYEFRALTHKNAPSYGAHLFGDYLCADIPRILVHVKESAAIPKIITEAKIQGASGRIILGVQSIEDAHTVRALAPEAKILSFAPKELIPKILALGIDYVIIWEAWIEDSLISLVKKSTAKLVIMSGEAEDGYPVGEPSDAGIARILKSEPDGILINDVRRI